METVKSTVAEAYELRALLLGLQIKNDKGEVHQLYPGFVTEKGISEGTKRIAHKAARVINTELEAIDKQRKEIQDAVYPAETDADMLPGAQEKAKAEKDAELLKESIEFQVELLDFTKVADLSLSFDYKVLYEKLFKNY